MRESSPDIQYEFDWLARGFQLISDWDTEADTADALNLVSEATLVHARTLLGFFVPTMASLDDNQALLAEHYCPLWNVADAKRLFNRVSGRQLHEVRNALNVKVMHLSVQRAALPRLDLGDVCRGVIAVQHVFVNRLVRPWHDTFRQV